MITRWIAILVGVLWIAEGLLYLQGKMKLSRQFKDREWKDKLMKFRGICFMCMGIPWVLVGAADLALNLPAAVLFLILIVIAAPAFLFSRRGEKSFRERAEREDNNL